MVTTDKAGWRAVSLLLDELLDADSAQLDSRLQRLQETDPVLAGEVRVLLSTRAVIERERFLEDDIRVRWRKWSANSDVVCDLLQTSPSKPPPSMQNASVTRHKPPSPATVVIADDHVLVRDGLKLLIREQLGDVHFLEAHDGDALWDLAGLPQTIHLALVDLKMPKMQGGLRLIELARRYPDIPLVIVSALRAAEVIRRIMRVPSVYAFVPKSAHRGHIRAAIEAAMLGKKALAESTAGGAPADVTLTPRQEQILSLLRQGFSNKMIARALGISEGTVKNHITEILRLLNATNRTQAALSSMEPQ